MMIPELKAYAGRVTQSTRNSGQQVTSGTGKTILFYRNEAEPRAVVLAFP
jgi:hypothetical protein